MKGMIYVRRFLMLFVFSLLFLSLSKYSAFSKEISISTDKESVNVGDEFYIYVSGDDLENLYTLTFSMKFTPYALEILSVSPGDILKDDKIKYNNFLTRINDNLSSINFFETFIGSSKGKTTNGEVLKIKAKLLRDCKVPLKITSGYDTSLGSPIDMVLVDNNLNKIDFTPQDLYIKTINFDDKDIKFFIKDVYNKTLSREPDDSGFTYWYDKLISFDYSTRDFLLNVLNEKEFIENNMSNNEFINSMYSIIANREPDSPGFNYWLNLLYDYEKYLSKKDSRINIILRICNEAELKERSEAMNLKF